LCAVGTTGGATGAGAGGAAGGITGVVLTTGGAAGSTTGGGAGGAAGATTGGGAGCAAGATTGGGALVAPAAGGALGPATSGSFTDSASDTCDAASVPVAVSLCAPSAAPDEKVSMSSYPRAPDGFVASVLVGSEFVAIASSGCVVSGPACAAPPPAHRLI